MYKGEESLNLAGMGVEQSYMVSLQNEGVNIDSSQDYWENQVKQPEDNSK